ncbi:beta-lactamase family protein [Adhaeribacter swui]|uniref:Beta-lactamase family protein n=1 Tax=Adhaeribacter swui TaxID=2086471 RepID=A0A7G7G9F6_9BACT|nr:serine hydrolase domain-containing protein [Adhaeribacter swui]QNF33790.1 beta-lactamase family protein [Adhaeribacter swui]
MNKALLLLFGLFFFWLPLLTTAQSYLAGKLDSFMQAQVASEKFNGNVLVAQSGKIIYQKAFGYRNYNTKEVLDNQSVFELASLSKPFTAMGILLLVEKNQLKLSDTLRKFFPQLPYSRVTLQHLLTHTAGLPDYMDMLKNWSAAKAASNKEVINFLAESRPVAYFKPGEQWKYSNTGYVLLASILEQVTGQTFSDYLTKYIFRPLKMAHSRVYLSKQTGEQFSNYATGYVYSDRRKRYVPPDSLLTYNFVIPQAGIQGDGGVHSTTADLLKWDRALKKNQLLSPATQQQMLAAQVAIDPSSGMYVATGVQHYGYGMGVGQNKYGNYLWHGGNRPGYATNLIRYVAPDVTIIVLANCTTSDNTSQVLKISNGIADLVLGK